MSAAKINQVLVTKIRRKSYLDSVALMRHSSKLAKMNDIAEAAMMMGTPANREIMFNAGLLESPTPDADGGDLIISVRGSDQASVDAAMEAAANLLDQRTVRAGTATAWQPRSIRSAVQQVAAANLALISVPGVFAVSEARKAIRAGLHAMIFSDNVPLQAEAELKQEAKALNRLVMGPDCGTSIINGVPLAFANKVRRGDIGVIGASGTGIQEVTCLIDHAGFGISQAIGVGGRDLKETVGGVSTLMAIDALIQDATTKHIVIISKPPAPSVANAVLALVGTSQKSFTICFIGARPVDYAVPENATLTTTLKQTVERATGKALPAVTMNVTALRNNQESDRDKIIGLYCGGTLCAEAQIIIGQHGQQVASNAPVPGALPLDQVAEAHQIIDLGADEYTQGKPHPMIEPSIRDASLFAALERPDVRVVLLDVVIGYGAHADPAGELARALAGVHRPVTVIASVTGTDADPQVRRDQMVILESAGIVVCGSNADAAELALQCVMVSEVA